MHLKSVIFVNLLFLKNLDHIKLVILLMHLLVLFKESEGPLKVTKAVTSVKHVDLFQCAFVNIDLTRDRTSHIFLHLQQSDECRNLCSKRNFSILDSTLNRRQLLLKEAAYILRENPTLNKQRRQAELVLLF